MTKQITLFSRYKNMIYNLWADGQRKYTANELNTFVGAYENKTHWKRWNNNPYYTTRTYQTALKHLGCISMVKRGVWQINAPIPEWFGSYHVNALLNSNALAELEKSSIYWQSLPAEHKINPWKTNNTKTTQTMNKSTDCIMQTITGLPLTPSFPQLTMTIQIAISPATANSRATVDLCDWEYHIEGKPVSVQTAEEIVKIFNQNLNELRAAAFKKIEEETIMETAEEVNQAQATSPVNTGERLYTEKEVRQIILSFLEEKDDLVRDIITDTFEGIDADDVVDLEWDSYNKSMNVSIDIDSNARDAAFDAMESLKSAIDDFVIEGDNN